MPTDDVVKTLDEPLSIANPVWSAGVAIIVWPLRLI